MTWKTAQHITGKTTETRHRYSGQHIVGELRTRCDGLRISVKARFRNRHTGERKQKDNCQTTGAAINWIESEDRLIQLKINRAQEQGAA